MKFFFFLIFRRDSGGVISEVIKYAASLRSKTSIESVHHKATTLRSTQVTSIVRFLIHFMHAQSLCNKITQYHTKKKTSSKENRPKLCRNHFVY
jgi:hypothetical protein